MKNSLILFALVAFSSSLFGQADAISRYFDKYLEDDRFTVVYISPKMFQLFDRLDVDMELEEDEEAAIKDMVSDLRGLRILTSDVDVDALYQEATNKINTKEYEILMTVRNKRESDIQLLIKDEDNGDTISELLMLVGGRENFVLMSFVGNISLDKVAKLSDSLNED
ncbi:MAG: DUF4252 domain-containing protein [Bacteroidota bacterium]